jgi:hypothetical protein
MSTPISFIALMLTAALHGSDMPVTVSQVVTGPSSHVRLTNTSPQAVTAWSLATTSVSGDRTHREVYTSDGYLSEVTHGLAGASTKLERLMPGESRELPLDPLPQGATVEVIAVVLDDGTAIGDEPAIASMFATRVKERDALRAVVDTFNDVLPTMRGAAALDALKERLTVLAQRDQSIPCRAALDAVQAYARKTNPDEIDQSLRTYADFVKREYEVAARNSERRVRNSAA